MMHQLPPVNLAHGPEANTNKAQSQTATLSAATAAVHTYTATNASITNPASRHSLGSQKKNIQTAETSNEASTHTHRNDALSGRVSVKLTTSSPSSGVSGPGTGSLDSGRSVNIYHSTHAPRNPKEQEQQRATILDTTSSFQTTQSKSATPTPVNRMSSAATAVNMSMSPSHGSNKQTLAVSSSASFATPDTAEQRKVVGQVHGDRKGPIHRMTFMGEDNINMNMNCPTSNGSAAATVVSLRESEVQEPEAEVDVNVDVDVDVDVNVPHTETNDRLPKTCLKRSGSILPETSASDTNLNTATVTPSNPALPSSVVSTTTSTITTSTSAIEIKQGMKMTDSDMKPLGGVNCTSTNKKAIKTEVVVDTVEAAIENARKKDVLAKKLIHPPQCALSPMHERTNKEAHAMVTTRAETHPKAQAVVSSACGSASVSVPSAVPTSATASGRKKGSTLSRSIIQSSKGTSKMQGNSTTKAHTSAASTSLPTQTQSNPSHISQQRSMTPVPPPSSQQTTKATRTPVRSPHPATSFTSMLHNANMMASDLFGSPGNSIFLSPAPGGGTKAQTMGISFGSMGMTPTNFATDFGKTDLSTQSFDANNVLPWLSPKAYELFSPGTAGITPGGGMTAGITPGNQMSSHGNRLHLSMPVSKLLAENNALSLPFEGNVSVSQDSAGGKESVDGSGLGKKRTLGSVLGKQTKAGTIHGGGAGAGNVGTMGHGRQVSQGSTKGQGICVSPLARKTSKMMNPGVGSDTPINFHDVFASPKADGRASGMGYMSMNMTMGEHEIPHLSEGRQVQTTSTTQALEKDLAERDVMEDEDLNVLLKLAETTPRRNGADGKSHARMFRGGNGTFAYPAVEPLYTVESVGGGVGAHAGTIHGHGPPPSLHLPIIGKRSPTPGSHPGVGPLPKSLLQRTISSGSGGGRHALSPKRRKSISQSPASTTTPGSTTSANSGPGYHPSSHHHLPHRPPPQGYYPPPYMHGHGHPHGHPMAHGHHPPYPYTYPPHGHGQSGHGHPPPSHPSHAPYMYPSAGSSLPAGPDTVKDIKKKMNTKNPSSKSSIKGGGISGSGAKSSKRPLSTSVGTSSISSSKKSRKSSIRGRGPGKKKIPASAQHAASMNSIDKQKAAATISAINNKSGKKNDRAASLAAAVLRGVTMRPSGKWQAQLYFAGKSRYIGVFDSREKAALAYEIAREHLQHKTASGSGKDTEAHVNAARKAAFEGVNENDPRGS